MKIAKITNNRIYFAEDKFYRTSLDIILEYGLKKGMLVEGEKERELLVELIIYRALFFLIKRDYAEKELKDKLKFEFFKDAPFDRAMEKLSEKGYLDDYSYAKNYIENKKISKKRVYYDLTSKGIKKEIVDEIYSEIPVDEKPLIIAQLKKLENKEERKKIEYLLRKGYNLRDILEGIKELNNDF